MTIKQIINKLIVRELLSLHKSSFYLYNNTLPSINLLRSLKKSSNNPSVLIKPVLICSRPINTSDILRFRETNIIIVGDIDPDIMDYDFENKPVKLKIIKFNNDKFNNSVKLFGSQDSILVCESKIDIYKKQIAKSEIIIFNIKTASHSIEDIEEFENDKK